MRLLWMGLNKTIGISRATQNGISKIRNHRKTKAENAVEIKMRKMNLATGGSNPRNGTIKRELAGGNGEKHPKKPVNPKFSTT